MQADLPLELRNIRRLQNFAPRFAELCDEIAAYGIPESIQRDDLHHNNLYTSGSHLRVLDWGDSSIAHPFHVACGHLPLPRARPPRRRLCPEKSGRSSAARSEGARRAVRR
jgi:hypothetical protein